MANDNLLNPPMKSELAPTLQPSAKVVNSAWSAFLLNLANLLKVKSIVTIMVMGALTHAFLNGIVAVDIYAPMATAIMTYYFMKPANP